MFFIPASYPLRRVIKDFILVLNFTVCFCFFTQQVPEKVGQSDAVYEVVSLQREAERSNEKRERLTSAPEEEEAEEGKILFFCCCCFVTVYIQLLQMIVLLDILIPIISGQLLAPPFLPHTNLMTKPSRSRQVLKSRCKTADLH